MIVVDSSVLIDLLKGVQSAPANRLRGLELEGSPFALPGICFQEVLQGAKDEREWKLLSAYLGTQDLLFASDPAFTYRKAARIYFDCRRKGITIRSSADCFIAQLVLEHDAILLHDDDDFEYISKVRPLKTLRE